jgi:hypothetical protein
LTGVQKQYIFLMQRVTVCSVGGVQQAISVIDS